MYRNSINLKYYSKNMNISLMEHLENSTWNTEPISLQLMETHCKPVHARVYTVPRSVKQQLQKRKEIVQLVDIGVLEEDYSSEWSSIFLSFAIPKKNGTIRVVTDFRKSSIQLIVEA
jgi:hypothetical protein